MPRQSSASVENNFVKGLITEATGLNFPENACTDADNVVFNLTGNVTRRPGMDFESNFSYQSDISSTGKAVSTYLWKNASGDGLTQIYVIQVGNTLTFYNASTATTASPLSTQRILTSVNITNFLALGSVADTSVTECQYADGNGYLFVFHPDCDPFYCSLNTAGTAVTGTTITVKIRDFLGVLDNIPVNVRPSVLGQLHPYNLQNQGWTSGNSWGTTSSSVITASVGVHVFVVGAGLPVVIGQQVAIADSGAYLVGVATAYAGTNLTVNVTSTSNPTFILGGSGSGTYVISSLNTSLIDNFFTAVGIYPSNADIWWTFKNTLGVFSPATTIDNVTLSLGNAPKGHFVLDAFNQKRTALSGIAGLSDLVTVKRPNTGTWFQGRVWYAGLNASQAPATSNPFYTWTENIYFSQIITSSVEFGLCYQNNDPTSEEFADLLPSDGGVIQIQGCGSIYKLFPIQNGLLVFASNGIWFITGSQGIGFTANDYTVTKLSGVQSISGTSFVNAQGFPVFWNEEGIYAVSPNQQGTLEVNNICLGTILSFYADIPSLSKKYVRGDYNPLTYVIDWVYRDTTETTITSRYKFNRILSFNTSTKSFYPSSMSNLGGLLYVNDAKYVSGPTGGSAAESTFKYLTYLNNTHLSFAEQRDVTNWVDFINYDSVGEDYESFFIPGYKLKGGALRRWQPVYVNVFTNTNDVVSGYKIQGIWDFATSTSSGRYSGQQVFYTEDPYVSVSEKRIKIRGHGKALQLKFTSIPGYSFDVIGWATLESANATV